MKTGLCFLTAVLLTSCFALAEQVNWFDLCGPTKESQFRRWGYQGHFDLDWDIRQDSEFSGGYAISATVPVAADQTANLTWTTPVLYFDRVDVFMRSAQELTGKWFIVFEDGTQIESGVQDIPVSKKEFSKISLDLLQDGSVREHFTKQFPDGVTKEFLEKAGVRLITLQIKPATTECEEIQFLIDRLETVCK